MGQVWPDILRPPYCGCLLSADQLHARFLAKCRDRHSVFHVHFVVHYSIPTLAVLITPGLALESIGDDLR